MKIAWFVLLTSLACSPFPASAMGGGAPEPFVQVRDGQHDFDDSFGSWDVHIARLERPLTGSKHWLEYHGTHTITPLWNGRANIGTLEADGPAGHIEALSPRLYNPATGQWSVRYASSRDGVMGVPHVGRFTNGRGVFIGQDLLGDQTILVRNTYWAESADRHRFEVAYSDDGGASWETNWAMTESRIAANIARAVGDSRRSAADRALDGGRHPAALLAFAGVAEGDKVVDLMPGSGYFTELMSALVGERGKVYALQPAEMDRAAPDGTRSLRALAASPGHANVTVLIEPVDALTVPEPVRLVWTSQNYHDLHVPFMAVRDIARVNRAIFDMLAPGGVLMVVDHAAAPSSGFSQSDALHRIDPQTVRAELLAAGFEFVGQSAVLRNPADQHAIAAFDPSMKGKTDRFVYKFRKPLKGEGK